MAVGLLTVRAEPGQAQVLHVPSHRDRWPGGAAGHDPATLKELGVETIHAWGMTEMSPLGTVVQPAG
ncbi:hypothetical protein ACU4GD_38495 [Cupriavidus basilensis]